MHVHVAITRSPQQHIYYYEVTIVSQPHFDLPRFALSTGILSLLRAQS